MKLTTNVYVKEGFINIYKDNIFMLCVKNTQQTIDNLTKAIKLLDMSQYIEIEFNINRDFEITGGSVTKSNGKDFIIYKDKNNSYDFIYTYRKLEEVEEITTNFTSNSWDREYTPNYTTESSIIKVIKTTIQTLDNNKFSYSYNYKTFMKDGSVLEYLPDNCELDLDFNKVILSKKSNYNNVIDGMFPQWEADGFEE